MNMISVMGSKSLSSSSVALRSPLITIAENAKLSRACLIVMSSDWSNSLLLRGCMYVAMSKMGLMPGP